MNERKKIENKIAKKEAEIQELEVKIGEAKAYMQALSDVLKMLPRDFSDADASPDSMLRAGSQVALARDEILKQGKPLHISDLLKALGKELTRDTRASLSGSISAYVRKGEIFTRPAPNVFGLLEMNDETVETETPPDNFGTYDDDDVPF